MFTADFNRRNFIQSMSAAAFGAALSLTGGCKKEKPKEPGAESHQELDKQVLAECHAATRARYTPFEWPRQYLKKDEALNQISAILNHHNRGIEKLILLFPEVGLAQGLVETEKLYRSTYQTLLTTGLFNGSPKEYSVDNFRNLLYYKIPQALSKYGVLVEPISSRLYESADRKRIFVLGTGSRLVEVSQGIFETVRPRGRKIIRARFDQQRVIEDVSDGLNATKPEVSSARSMYGHVLVLPEALGQNRLDYVSDFEKLVPILQKIGGDFQSVRAHLETVQDPISRTKQVREYAYILALTASREMFYDDKRYNDYIVQEHEDRHVDDIIEGRLQSLIGDSESILQTDLPDFVLNLQIWAESSAILGDFCNTREGAFGMATVLKRYLLHVRDNATSREKENPHGNAAQWVIRIAFKTISRDSISYQMDIDPSSVLTKDEQILLQLYKLSAMPEKLKMLEEDGLRALFPAYYRMKSKEQ